MTEFISLEDFLLLPESDYKEFREFSKHKTGYQWYYWYQLAKASFNQFGTMGPPIGSEVLTLVSGHGGSGGNKRIFSGVYVDDPRFFILKSDESNDSLVTKKTW